MTEIGHRSFWNNTSFIQFLAIIFNNRCCGVFNNI